MLVQVWNNNVHPYREKFIDRVVEIPAGEYIDMDEDEAERFLSQFTPPKRDGQERPDPKYFKKLKIVKNNHKPADVNPLMVHATGQAAKSEDEYKAIVSSLAHLLAKDPEADAEAASQIAAQNKQLKKENKVLRSRLEIIEEKLGLKGSEDDGADLQSAG